MEIATILEKVLDVQLPWEIKDVEVIHSGKVLRIKIGYLKESKFPCPKCGGESLVHDGKYREWRHLDFMQYNTFLEIKIPRTKCEQCGILTIKELPFARTNSHYSFFFERLIINKASIMSISAMSREINEPDQNLWRVIKHYITQGLDQRCRWDLSKIAVDEKAYKKGHEYVTIFTDLDTGTVIFVTKGRKKEVFKEFRDWLFYIGLEADCIHLFSMDMSKSFQAGREECFPQAEVVFDRFHIKKLLNECLDKVRKREISTNNKLINTKYLWLKNEENLTEKKQNKMKELYDEMNIDTVKAYHQKQFFDKIWIASK